MYLSNFKIDLSFLTYIAFLIIGLTTLESAFADVIQLKGDKKIYGQALAINANEIIIETISEKDAALEITTFPRNLVLKITDESGTVLFDQNHKNYENLNSFYILMINNWEELKDKIKKADEFSITFQSLEKITAKIVSITEDYVFIETRENDSENLIVNRFPLKNIIEIDNIKVIHANLKIPKRLLLSETKYPLYQISIGPDYVMSNYSELQFLFQDFYDQNGINKKAGKRADTYPGVYMKFEMYLSPYLALGLSAQFYNSKKINALALTMVDIKYVYRTAYLHPWIAIGYTGQDFRSSETAEDIKYDWHSTNNTVCFGTGLDSGKELGVGFNLAVYYLPFGKDKAEIKIDDINQNSLRKIDFSLIKISLGIHYNFN